MKNRSFQLKYGRGEISAHAGRGLPPTILAPQSPKPETDAFTLIKDALKTPIGAPALEAIVSHGDRVVIIASDHTRATASDVFLPIIVDELNSAGIPDQNIAIVFALGIHRAQTEKERRSLMGDRLYGRIRSVDHDARDKPNLVLYGRTSRGTEVAVNRTAAQADKVILTGAVSPHYFAGFGGGRKSIMPGVCSHEASLQSHQLVFNRAPARGRNPNVSVARLAGNPVHEDMLEAATMMKPHFMLNTIVGSEKEVVAAFAGDFISAHEAACKYYLGNFSVAVREPADLTIVSCGGYPKDINFIQAHKAIHSAYSVTRPGGWMIVLAECGNGFGYPGFADWFRFDNVAQFEKGLRANYEIYGQTAYATFEKSTTVNIVLVSELDHRDVQRMKIHHASTFEEAYSLACDNLRKDFTTYIIPASSSSLFFTERELSKVSASVSGVTNIDGRKVS